MRRLPARFAAPASRLIAALILATALATPPAVSLAQQPAWDWPDKPKNLKVLPKGTSAQDLRAAMMGFTRSLGVRCVHCHIGKDGEPLGTFDFASDENPKKNVAREMLRMVGSVNDRIREIRGAGADRVEVRCITCHRGRPLPRTLVEELTMAYDRAGADSTVALYRGLHARFAEAGAYDFRPASLNEIGRRALETKDPHGAVSLFALNAEVHPDASLAHAALGEAHAAAGDTAKAVAALERAVQLEPRNQHAAKMLEGLRGAGGR